MVLGYSSFADCLDYSWSHTEFILFSLIPSLLWGAEAVHQLNK